MINVDVTHLMDEAENAKISSSGVEIKYSQPNSQGPYFIDYKGNRKSDKED